MKHNDLEVIVFMYSSIQQREEQIARLLGQGYLVPEQQGQLFYIEGERVWTKMALRPAGSKMRHGFDPIAELQRGCLEQFLKPINPPDLMRGSMLKDED